MKKPKWVVFDFSGTLYYFQDKPIKQMWDLAKDLKSAGYKLAICTNISLSDRKHLEKFDLFEEIIDFEVHQTKNLTQKYTNLLKRHWTLQAMRYFILMIYKDTPKKRQNLDGKFIHLKICLKITVWMS
jgi:FMN phosphatase YigB (HAD superfamily)